MSNAAGTPIEAETSLSKLFKKVFPSGREHSFKQGGMAIDQPNSVIYSCNIKSYHWL